MKSTPTAFAASSKALPMTGESFAKGAQMMLAGVTDTLLFTIGIPYSRERSSQTLPIFSALVQILS